MASFAISGHFGTLLAAEGLQVTGLDKPHTRRSARLHLPCGGSTAKRIFNRLFHAAYQWTHDGMCDCCYYYERKEDHIALQGIRKVLGVVEPRHGQVR